MFKQIVLLIFLMLLFIVFILNLFMPKFKPKNIKRAGQKCLKILGMPQRVGFRIDKTKKFNSVHVKKKFKHYEIILKHNSIASIIHELIHIKKGQSDIVADLPDFSLLRYTISLVFDIYNLPCQIRYSLKIKENF